MNGNEYVNERETSGNGVGWLGLEWARDPDEKEENKVSSKKEGRKLLPEPYLQLSAGIHPVPELCALKSPESLLFPHVCCFC